MSYEEAKVQINCLGSGIKHLDLAPPVESDGLTVRELHCT